ncbi:hypothetical protein QBC46DRAFT_421034, partial [Diplogelasinospora grovesii]
KGWFVYGVVGANVYIFYRWQQLFVTSPHKYHHNAFSSGRHRVLGMPDPNASFLERHFTVSLPNWDAGRWWTALTSSVSHIDLLHLSFTLVSFVTAATQAIDVGISNGHLLALCAGSAVAGSLAKLWDDERRAKQQPSISGGRIIQTTRPPPTKQLRASLGGSAMCMGLYTMLACMFPHTKSRITWAFIPIMDVESWAMPLVHLGISGLLMNYGIATDDQANALGGLVFGAVY